LVSSDLPSLCKTCKGITFYNVPTNTRQGYSPSILTKKKGLDPKTFWSYFTNDQFWDDKIWRV